MNTVIHIDVIKPGLLSLIQDGGRPGYQAFGVPPGGPLDRKSAALANWLVGQAAGQPVLEITLLGPELYFRHPTQIALTGADLSATINQLPVEQYTTLDVHAGDRLCFGERISGCRAYLAIRGSWQCDTWLGSAGSLFLYDRVLPPDSRLTAGRRLVLHAEERTWNRQIPVAQRPFLTRQLSLRIWPGPEYAWFSNHQIRYVTSHVFQLSPQCSRMGYQLDPPLPDYLPAAELISSGIIPGTIQIVRSGRPIILLADAQTTGGYPRLANVISDDLDDLAQLAPGDSLRFTLSHG